MAKRKTIGKKLRFEVFKRDSFTCQYCGKTAPNVILEIDHINPVAEGGDNSITNLITSCRDCNRGKGKRKLTDTSVVDKQQKQLSELQEKHNQLEMMIQWKEGLTDILDEQVNYINDKLSETTGYHFLDNYKHKLRTTLSKIGFSYIYDSFEICIDKFYTKDSEEYANNILGNLIKIGYSLYYENSDPKKSSIKHIANTLKTHVSYFDTKSFYTRFPVIYETKDKEAILKLANKARSFTNFFDLMEEYYNE